MGSEESTHKGKTLSYCGMISLSGVINSYNNTLYFKFNYYLTNLFLRSYPYSDYQKMIIEKIFKFRKMGFSDRKISKFFNDNGILSVRGRKFSCGLVWEIRKKYIKRKKRSNNKIEGKFHSFRYEIE